MWAGFSREILLDRSNTVEYGDCGTVHLFSFTHSSPHLPYQDMMRVKWIDETSPTFFRSVNTKYVFASWNPNTHPVAVLGSLRGRGGRNKKGTSAQKVVVKQFQTLVKIKIGLLYDSDLKYNYYTSVITAHKELLTI